MLGSVSMFTNWYWEVLSDESGPGSTAQKLNNTCLKIPLYSSKCLNPAIFKLNISTLVSELWQNNWNCNRHEQHSSLVDNELIELYAFELIVLRWCLYVTHNQICDLATNDAKIFICKFGRKLLVCVFVTMTTLKGFHIKIIDQDTRIHNKCRSHYNSFHRFHTVCFIFWVENIPQEYQMNTNRYKGSGINFT